MAKHPSEVEIFVRVANVPPATAKLLKSRLEDAVEHSSITVKTFRLMFKAKPGAVIWYQVYVELKPYLMAGALYAGKKAVDLGEYASKKIVDLIGEVVSTWVKEKLNHRYRISILGPDGKTIKSIRATPRER
jgi:hypothetical protein